MSKTRRLESHESSEEHGTDSGPEDDPKAPGETSQDEAEHTPAKRSRGRPRKHPRIPEPTEPQIKRPRGRPKGSPNKDRAPSPEPQEKRVRGRPKRTISREKQLELEGLPRGRGRPKGKTRKNTGGSPGKRGSGRPSGRPSGSPNKGSKVSTPPEESEEAEEGSSPDKRGPGRPKGSPNKRRLLTKEKVPGLPRGRPKKIPVEETEDVTEEEKDDHDSDIEEIEQEDLQ